ncbi:MAG: hypothetical protein PHH77_06345 [Victivallaceae bacterium]|nr:hypothetical protein [Victivallaceae bacterium]
MQITEDIIKALHNCIDAVGSISEFSQQANVNIETVSKYLSRKTNSIKKESWDKLYPLIHPYLAKSAEANANMKARKAGTARYSELSSDEKILLDAFSALPRELQEKQLLEIVELARKQVHETKYEA